MKTDKLLHLIQQKKVMRSGGALPLPKAVTGNEGQCDPKTEYWDPKLKRCIPRNNPFLQYNMQDAYDYAKKYNLELDDESKKYIDEHYATADPRWLADTYNTGRLDEKGKEVWEDIPFIKKMDDIASKNLGVSDWNKELCPCSNHAKGSHYDNTKYTPEYKQRVSTMMKKDPEATKYFLAKCGCFRGEDRNFSKETTVDNPEYMDKLKSRLKNEFDSPYANSSHSNTDDESSEAYDFLRNLYPDKDSNDLYKEAGDMTAVYTKDMVDDEGNVRDDYARQYYEKDNDEDPGVKELADIVTSAYYGAQPANRYLQVKQEGTSDKPWENKYFISQQGEGVVDNEGLKKWNPITSRFASPNEVGERRTIGYDEYQRLKEQEDPNGMVTYQEFKKGGPLPKAQIGTATAADSLTVYNNAVALDNFYKKELAKKNIQVTPPNPGNPGISRTAKINPKNKKDIEQFKQDIINLKYGNALFYQDEINQRVSGKGRWPLRDKFYKDEYNLSNNDLLKIAKDSYARLGIKDRHKVYYRDIITGQQHLASPLALLDDRILPQNIIEYAPPISLMDSYPGGAIVMYRYDPLAVKPEYLRTEKENIEWQKKYGKPLPPVNIKPIISKDDYDGLDLLSQEKRVALNDPIYMEEYDNEPLVTFSQSQPSAPISLSLRKEVNPSFNNNIDKLSNRNKEAVVDSLGNPRYVYYNGDKVISEKEYKKLSKQQGGLTKAQAGLNLNHGFSWKDVQSAKDNTAQKQREEKQQEGLWAQRDNTQHKYNIKDTPNYTPQLTPLQIADLATDVMQMGHFVPHPIAQGIGLAGDMVGAPIDAYQAGQAKARGDYNDMTTNLAFALSSGILARKGYRRDMWNTNAGSFADRLAKSGSRDGTYIPLTAPLKLANNPVIQKGIMFNRGLLLNQGLETAYDSQYGEPVNNQSVENSFGTNKELMPDEEWAISQGYDLDAWRALPSAAKTKLMMDSKDESMYLQNRMKPVDKVLKTPKKNMFSFEQGGTVRTNPNAQQNYFQLLINQKNKK
jgi:hypothetical protein